MTYDPEVHDKRIGTIERRARLILKHVTVALRAAETLEKKETNPARRAAVADLEAIASRANHLSGFAYYDDRHRPRPVKD
jgi:hypothetical protein